MTAFLITASSVLGSGILFGFLPGFLLRPFLWIYPKGSSRPEEILGELYVLPYRKRILWAFQHIEVAIFDGCRERRRRRSKEAEVSAIDEVSASTTYFPFWDVRDSSPYADVIFVLDSVPTKHK